MKASTPVFIHTQHPMLVFFMPPGWLIIIFGVLILTYICLNIVLPELSMIIAGMLSIAMAVIVKVKMGDDRHSDYVFFMGLHWRLKHRSGRLISGGHDV